jgi:hypothetical protein
MLIIKKKCLKAAQCRSKGELSTRRVEVGGIASKANGLWMIQVARNLTDGVDGFFKGKRYLIHDRDPLYTQQFLNMLGEAGIESLKLPAGGGLKRIGLERISG